MKESIIQKKSFDFALKLIELFRLLKTEKEFVVSQQFLKSGTSIGANVEEASAAQSKKDFIAKMAISSKEARETKYWIRLLRDSDWLDQANAETLLNDIEEILKMTASTIKTVKSSKSSSSRTPI